MVIFSCIYIYFQDLGREFLSSGKYSYECFFKKFLLHDFLFTSSLYTVRYAMRQTKRKMQLLYIFFFFFVKRIKESKVKGIYFCHEFIWVCILKGLYAISFRVYHFL